MQPTFCILSFKRTWTSKIHSSILANTCVCLPEHCCLWKEKGTEFVRCLSFCFKIICMITSYFHLLQSCWSLETLLIGIYNLEVIDESGQPKVVSFRLPSLAQSSIYHEVRVSEYCKIQLNAIHILKLSLVFLSLLDNALGSSLTHSEGASSFGGMQF